VIDLVGRDSAIRLEGAGYACRSGR
jgi:hypothetical protein